MLLEAISITIIDFFKKINFLQFGRNNENLNKKKWVRNVENDNINISNPNNLQIVEMSKKTTNQTKKDTIEKKNN